MAERKIQLVDDEAREDQKAPAVPMDVGEPEAKAAAPMDVEAPAAEESKEEDKPKEQKKQARKRIFASSLCEKILDFRAAVETGMQGSIKEFTKNCDEILKSEAISPREAGVMSQDILNILRISYSNAMQLQTCVFHQYNYERSTQPVDSNFKPIEPEFTLVGTVTKIRNNLALWIQGYTQFISKTDIKQVYDLEKEAKSIPIYRQLAVNAWNDCDVLSRIAIGRAYDMCSAILPARFLIEDEKTRAVKMREAILTKYPSLFTLSVDGKEGKFKELTPRWPQAVEEPPRPVSAFRTAALGGAKALADAKRLPQLEARRNEKRMPPPRSGAFISGKKQAKKSS